MKTLRDTIGDMYVNLFFNWKLLGILLLLTLLWLALSGAAFAHPRTVVPRQAALYRATIVREVRFYWGMAENPAIFMAQIHAESAFREDARSPVGAEGLAQIMPRTNRWLLQIYAKDLMPLCPSKTGCPLDPHFSIRALVMYDKFLWNQFTFVDAQIERWAFTLASYNGGIGNAKKELSACMRSKSVATPARTKLPPSHVCSPTGEYLPAITTSFINSDYPGGSSSTKRYHYPFSPRGISPQLPMLSSLPFSGAMNYLNHMFPIMAILPFSPRRGGQCRPGCSDCSDSFVAESFISPEPLQCSRYFSSTSSPCEQMLTPAFLCCKSSPLGLADLASSFRSHRIIVYPTMHFNPYDCQIGWQKVVPISVDMVNLPPTISLDTKQSFRNQRMNGSGAVIDSRRWITAKVKYPLIVAESQAPQYPIQIRGKLNHAHESILPYQGQTVNCSKWFGSVENFCLRTEANCQENRNYPRRILLELRHHYE